MPAQEYKQDMSRWSEDLKNFETLSGIFFPLWRALED